MYLKFAVLLIQQSENCIAVIQSLPVLQNYIQQICLRWWEPPGNGLSHYNELKNFLWLTISQTHERK